MNTQQFAASDRLELVHADHDVAIKGWDEEAIKLVVDGEIEQCDVEQQESALVLTAHVPVAIHVPRGTTLAVGEVSDDLVLRDLDGAVQVSAAHGDVSVRSGHASVSLDAVHGDLAVELLNGPLSVNQAYGDVHLNQVGAVTLGRVQGDVNARAVAGELRIGAASGDVRARDVAGLLTLEEGQGDFNGHDLAGGMNVHSVAGSLSIKTDLTPGLAYSGQAGGDIVARFAEGASARLTLEAKGQLSAKGIEVETHEKGRMTAHAGAGEAQVVFHAGGDLSVKVRGESQDEAWGFSMDDLSEQIQAEISQHMGRLNLPDFGALASREVEKAMRQVERDIEKAQRKAERATQRAQEQAHRAQERARKAQEKAQRQAKQFHTRFERGWQQPPDAGFGAHGHAPHGRAGGTTRPKPSREEQLAILKMLQEGKISTEEAEILLQALGV